jgi:anthranilate synthase component II
VKALIVDAFDSFSHIIYQYISGLGWDTEVIRSGVLSVPGMLQRSPDVVVLGPGPGHPVDSGHVELVEQLAGNIPLFGVCLGLQAMGLAFGGEIGQATQLMHGKTSAVEHDSQGAFKGLPSPLRVTRYHSLAVLERNFPAELEICARALDDGTIMAFRHRSLALAGVQFHPESIGTEHGMRIFDNALSPFIPAS